MFGNPFAGAAEWCAGAYNQIPSRNDIYERMPGCPQPICTAWDTVKWGANAVKEYAGETATEASENAANAYAAEINTSMAAAYANAAAAYANTCMQATIVKPFVNLYGGLSSAKKELVRLVLILGDPILSIVTLSKVFFDWICANIHIVQHIKGLTSEADEASEGTEESEVAKVIAAAVGFFISINLTIGLIAFTDDIFRRSAKNNGYPLNEKIWQSEALKPFRNLTLGLLGLLAVASMSILVIDIGDRLNSFNEKMAIIAQLLVSLPTIFVAVVARKAFNDSDGKHKLPQPTSCLYNPATARVIGWGYSIVSTAPFFMANAYGKPFAEFIKYGVLSALILIKEIERFTPPIENSMRLLPTHIIKQTPLMEFFSWVGSLATVELGLDACYSVGTTFIDYILEDSMWHGLMTMAFYLLIFVVIPGAIFLQIAGGFPQKLEPAAEGQRFVGDTDDPEAFSQRGGRGDQQNPDETGCEENGGAPLSLPQHFLSPPSGASVGGEGESGSDSDQEEEPQENSLLTTPA